jgi:hypothetical protein
MRHTRRRESPGPSRRLSGERVSRGYGDYIGGDQLRPCRRRQACRTRRRSARPDVVGSRLTEAHKLCARRPPRGRLHRPLRRCLGPQLARGGFQLFSKSARTQPSAVTCQHFSISAFWFRLLPLPRSWIRGSRWIKFSANRIDEVFCGATRLACASRTNPPISREVL